MTDYSLTVFAAIVPVLGGAGAYPPTTHINAMSRRVAVWAGPLAYTARWQDGKARLAFVQYSYLQ